MGHQYWPQNSICRMILGHGLSLPLQAGRMTSFCGLSLLYSQAAWVGTVSFRSALWGTVGFPAKCLVGKAKSIPVTGAGRPSPSIREAILAWVSYIRFYIKTYLKKAFSCFKHVKNHWTRFFFRACGDLILSKQEIRSSRRSLLSFGVFPQTSRSSCPKPPHVHMELENM